MKKMLSYAAQASAGKTVLDYTPEKSACLTLFHFEGDSNFYNLVQNAQVNLQYGIDGYDKSVVLKDDFISVGQTQPTSVLKPNKVIFLNQLLDLVNTGHYVDIRIFAHGSPDKIYVANGLTITTADLKALLTDSSTHFKKLPIRSVYQMNCYGQSFNQTWLDIGAIAVCGARAVNFFPNQYNVFAKEWSKGNVLFDKAVYDSNTELSRSVMEALIEVDAASQLFPKTWDKCPIGSTVLGDKPCAKSYFCANWSLDDVWQAGQSGKENMKYSSFMFTPGVSIIKDDKAVLNWA